MSPFLVDTPYFKQPPPNIPNLHPTFNKVGGIILWNMVLRYNFAPLFELKYGQTYFKNTCNMNTIRFLKYV